MGTLQANTIPANTAFFPREARSAAASGSICDFVVLVNFGLIDRRMLLVVFSGILGKGGLFLATRLRH